MRLSGSFYRALAFRAPGEAQKIDRIMEMFAERYCKCNPKVFSSADTAYALAYSVIMLNTDAHNPMVKNKMSPDDFIRNNLGIDDGKDLPEEYLRSVYYAATDVVISRFMIEVYWAPMLAAFSVPLDQSDDEVVIALCLEGIHCAIHVIAVMSMKTHRDAFVTSLAKFTSLHSPADIKQKNIDAIKNDSEKAEQTKSTILPVLKKKGPGRMQ
ncbi:unnamed protein product [Dovyalis caffra]|uniref:SEC7 domain-containing protein n=1 Tax=Dovyalis caffra TaxID=77055 RepID=A0AAV1RXC0_9ROSI|nr:unnamed protein product [Dovyalis caffra]